MRPPYSQSGTDNVMPSKVAIGSGGTGVGSAGTSVAASVAAGSSVATGSSVAAGSAGSAGSAVGAPPQAARTRLARMTSENRIVSWRFTVSPPRIESWIRIVTLGLDLKKLDAAHLLGNWYADYTAK